MTEEIIVTNPSVGGLLRKAKREPVVKLPAVKYVDVILTLRNKGYSHKDIVQWLKDHGAGAHSVSTISAVVVKARKETEHEQA